MKTTLSPNKKPVFCININRFKKYSLYTLLQISLHVAHHFISLQKDIVLVDLDHDKIITKETIPPLPNIKELYPFFFFFFPFFSFFFPLFFFFSFLFFFFFFFFLFLFSFFRFVFSFFFLFSYFFVGQHYPPPLPTARVRTLFDTHVLVRRR